jgi:hypothetical protein
MISIAWNYGRTSVFSTVKTDRVAELGNSEGKRHRAAREAGGMPQISQSGRDPPCGARRGLI